MRTREDKLRIFKVVAPAEREYLSRNRRLEILQLHWGILTPEEKTFGEINRIVGTTRTRDEYDEMIAYFQKKGYIAPLAKCGIYFIKAEHSLNIKVGKSINAQNRKRDLQTGSPVRLWVDYVIPVPKDLLGVYEPKCHSWFSQWRDHNEWFAIPPEEMDIVRSQTSHEDLDTLFSTDPSRLSHLIISKQIYEEDEGYAKEEELERDRERIREQGWKLKLD